MNILMELISNIDMSKLIIGVSIIIGSLFGALIKTLNNKEVMDIIGSKFKLVTLKNIENTIKLAEFYFNTPGMGKEKKEYVLSRVKDSAMNAGLSEEDLDCLIDNIVNILNEGDCWEDLNNQIL